MRVMMMSQDWTVFFSLLKPMILTCLFVTFGIQGSREVSAASFSENRDLQHPVASSLSSSIPSSSSLGNYSFPDSPEAISFGQLINDTASITDPDGHHMHVMEGDIAVVDDFENEVVENEELDSKVTKAKYAVNNNFRIWPEGKIPYVIDGSLWNSRARILAGMRHIQSKTCVTFIPRRNNHRDFIRIYQGGYRSCYSMIGRMGGPQGISLGNGCLVHGVIVHELMHAVGFYHMHSRSDRDNYLKILWPNINSNMQSQFRKNAPNQDQILRPFDYSSIMLYGPKLFSSNGGDTMIPRKRGVRLLDTGVKSGLSEEDAKSINILYGCSKSSPIPPRKGNRGHEEEEEPISSTTRSPPKKTTTVRKVVTKPRKKAFTPTTGVKPKKRWNTYPPPSRNNNNSNKKNRKTTKHFSGKIIDLNEEE